MTVPQRVVGKDESAGSHHAQRHFVGVEVGSLVSVDESHVECDAELRCFGDGIADDELYLVCHGRPFNPRPREVLLFVVDFKRIYLTAMLQSLGQADGTVAAERSHFENVLRTNHVDKHLQQAPLQVSAGHASAQEVNVRGAVEPVEVVAFRVDVVQDVLL